MKDKFKIMLVSCVVLVGWLVSAQFTEKRVKKGPSMAILKEQCCSVGGDFLKEIPSLLHAIADIQKEVIALIDGYYRSDKASFCNCTSRDGLIKSKESLEQVRETVKHLCAEIDTSCACLHSNKLSNNAAS